MIDLHCHVLPGVDDGAVDLVEAERAVERMYEQGTRTITVTPHVQATRLMRDEDARDIAERLDHAWDALTAACSARFTDLALRRGVELMLDHPAPRLTAEWLRLGGTRFVLVEFLGMLIPPRAGDVMATLVEQGYVPVVAHPERYRNGAADGREVRAWRDVGARLQVNCGSLLGMYGPDPCRRAWSLLETASVDYLASDYHARGRYPVEECRRVLHEEGAATQSELLLCTNPARLLDDLDPEDVPPTGKRLPPWKRLLRKRRMR